MPLFKLTMPFSVVVVAENEDAAWEVILANAESIIENHMDSSVRVEVRPLRTQKDIPEGWHDGIPWGKLDGSWTMDNTVSRILARIRKPKP